MKTVVKIDPEREYSSAKQVLADLSLQSCRREDISTLDSSIDNMKTVINVLMERLSPKPRKPPKKVKKKKKERVREDFSKLPSEKYPDLEVEEKIVRASEAPECPCCNSQMHESGLYKTSEKLEVIPKRYFISRNKRVVYNCRSCNGSMQNAPSLPSLSKMSNYGDSLIIDVSLSKYCDLIPIDRYCNIAARQGLEGLPANSMIGLTHILAQFLMLVYLRIKKEVSSSKLILMDETPHKMLEGDDTMNWYLWGFFSLKACYFEAHGTRSGDVPLSFLSESMMLYMLTDAYKGYGRAAEELRKKGKKIIEAFCNAHAYRYFKDASTTWSSETEIFRELYGKIYEIERQAKEKKEEEAKKLARQSMVPIFEEIKKEAERAKPMPHSSFEKAVNYFLNHYEGLTQCLNNPDIPLDNNFSERILRSPVVGRKTWYGTHSKRGAKTNSILFSIVASCKINDINPRNYIPWVVDRIHKKEQILTPYEYGQYIDSG